MLILGSRAWQERWRCWNRVDEDGKAIVMWCESCAEQRPSCDKWPDDIRRRAVALAGDPRIWKLARRHQPECLTDEVVSFLEVRMALLKLKEEDYAAWLCIESTDMAYMGGMNKNTAKRVQRTAQRIGCHPSTVYRMRQEAWAWVARQIVDTIAPEVVERVRG